jgi:hypothetical protein
MLVNLHFIMLVNLFLTNVGRSVLFYFIVQALNHKVAVCKYGQCKYC